MKKLIVTGLIISATLLCSACAIMVEKPKDLDTSKPIDIHEASVGFFLEQNEKIISQSDTIKKLGDIPDTRDDLSKRHIYFVSAMVTAVAGGGFAGWSIGSHQGDTALIAAGLITTSLILGHVSDVYLRKAVGTYNKKFESKSASSLEIYPTVTSSASGTSAGLALAF